MFNTDRVPPLAQKQINQYLSDIEKNYTYSGILKTLIYFYEIKHGDTSKAHNGIGIVPFLYDEAYQYYYALWQTRQENQRAIEKERSILKPKVVEIHIESPKRKVMGKKRIPFFFLEEEAKEGERVN